MTSEMRISKSEVSRTRVYNAYKIPATTSCDGEACVSALMTSLYESLNAWFWSDLTKQLTVGACAGAFADSTGHA